MGVFDNILSSDESLFKNDVALDYSFIPKLIPYRETQQRYIAECIKPLFQNRNGKNILIHGLPGVGKTVACKHVLSEIEEHTDDIEQIYINCWQKNTSFKIILEICNILGYKLTHNKKSDELFEIIKQVLNKKSVVFVFDEVDKLEDIDVVYTILEEIYRKSIIMITNFHSWIIDLDERIKSRLATDVMEFKPYNSTETEGILKQRMDYAFVSGVWEDSAFKQIANKTCELKDIRQGLFLLRESATIAEGKASRKVTDEHAKEAISKLDEFTVKDSDNLEDDLQFILKIIKDNSGKKMGDLFELYQKNGGKAVYRTFQRKIVKLGQNGFISENSTKGVGGNTTIIKYLGKPKKLTDY